MLWLEVVFSWILWNQACFGQDLLLKQKPTLCPPTVTNLRIEFSWKFLEACLSLFCVINSGIFHARRPGSVIFHCISVSVLVTWNKWLIFNPLTILFSDHTLVRLNSRKADKEGEEVEASSWLLQLCTTRWTAFYWLHFHQCCKPTWGAISILLQGIVHLNMEIVVSKLYAVFFFFFFTDKIRVFEESSLSSFLYDLMTTLKLQK